MKESRTNKRFRFSVAALLFGALCVAGILAGYRGGYEQGYASGKAQRQAEEPFAKVHEVGHLIQLAVDEKVRTGEASAAAIDNAYDSLIQAIQATVAPDHWEALGGPGRTIPSPENEAIIVHATADVQEHVETLLSDLDEARAAIRKISQERQRMQAAAAKARAEHAEKEWRELEKRVGKPLTPVPAGTTFQGTWNVHPETYGSPQPMQQYDFRQDGDVKTIAIKDSDGKVKRDEYSVSIEGQLIMFGMIYDAATTERGELVLIDRGEPETILVATEQ